MYADTEKLADAADEVTVLSITSVEVGVCVSARAIVLAPTSAADHQFADAVGRLTHVNPSEDVA
jgi:hypothetical protein